MVKDTEIMNRIVELESTDLSIDLLNEIIAFCNMLYVEMFNKRISNKSYDKYKNRIIDILVVKINDTNLCSLINATKLAMYIVNRPSGTIVKEITFVNDGVFSTEFDTVNNKHQTVNADSSNAGGFNEINSIQFNGFASYTQMGNRKCKCQVLANQINDIIKERTHDNTLGVIPDLDGNLAYYRNGIRIYINQNCNDVHDALENGKPLSIVIIINTDDNQFTCYQLNITYDKQNQRHWQKIRLPLQSAKLSDFLTYDSFEDLPAAYSLAD